MLTIVDSKQTLITMKESINSLIFYPIAMQSLPFGCSSGNKIYAEASVRVVFGSCCWMRPKATQLNLSAKRWISSRSPHASVLQTLSCLSQTTSEHYRKYYQTLLFEILSIRTFAFNATTWKLFTSRMPWRQINTACCESAKKIVNSTEVFLKL